MEIMGMTGVAAISVIAYMLGELVKVTKLENKWIPVICGVSGGVLGAAGMYLMPEFPAGDMVTAVAVGIVSGLAATGTNQMLRQIKE